MIEQSSPVTAHNLIKPLNQENNTHGKKVLSWVKNDRMAGKVPVWGYANNAVEETQATLETALNGTPSETTSFKNALAYQNTSSAPSRHKEEFGFGDLIDMINPLHHIPLVNYAYQEITGDTIKPISKLVGGSIFGGGVGLASSLATILIEEKTGQSLVDNILHGPPLSVNKDTDNENTREKYAYKVRGYNT